MNNATTATYERNPLLDEPCNNPQNFLNLKTGQTRKIRCGTRFANECPSCAIRYQIAERAVMEAGQPSLPDPTSPYPAPIAAFFTLTLGSFGSVEHHAPKFPHQYRYAAQIISSACEPELLRAFNMALHRATRHWESAGYQVAYRGSREIQERGAGHYHLIVTVSVANPETFNPTLLPTPPTTAELVDILEHLHLGSTAVPPQMLALSSSSTVTARRSQLGLPTASSSTLRIPPRVRFGHQTNVQTLNLHSNTEADPSSFGRKASYISKALTYTVKDLNKTAPGAPTAKNKKHLQRLANESFALLADHYLTESITRWFDTQITHETTYLKQKAAQAGAAGINLLHHLEKTLQNRQPMNPECEALGHLLIVRDRLHHTNYWQLLDGLSPQDFLVFNQDGQILPRSSKFTHLTEKTLAQDIISGTFSTLLQHHPSTHQFIIHHLTTYHNGTLTLTPLSITLLTAIRLKLRKLVTNHGHTGSCIASSKWGATKSGLRRTFIQAENQRALRDYRTAQKAHHFAQAQQAPYTHLTEQTIVETRQRVLEILATRAREKVSELEQQIQRRLIEISKALPALDSLNQRYDLWQHQAQIALHSEDLQEAIAWQRHYEHLQAAAIAQIDADLYEVERIRCKIRQLCHGSGAQIWIRAPRE